MKREKRKDMIIDPENERHIIADEGKEFKRINSSFIYGTEIYLGYSYHEGGKRLIEPHYDLPEDFEEVDIEPRPVPPIKKEI